MSDPYHTYENHNIQVNVFHVKGPLEGTAQEKYVFTNDSDKPTGNSKIIKECIYLSDTSEIVLHKIASCVKLDSKYIYAWIDHKPEKPFSCNKPIGINYADYDLDYMNPFIEKKIDDRFVNMDGSVKLNSKTYLDKYKILNSQFVNDQYNIYFTTLEDVTKYAESIFKEEETMIKNGYLKKYFPLIDEKNNLRLDEKIEIINSQKSILKEYTESPVDIRPINLVYKNRDKNIVLDLFKIFQEYEVSLSVPMIKIQTDNYMDSYIKFYKEGIHKSYTSSKDKTITKELFEKWNKSIYISDGFSRPRSVDKNNSLTFILYDSKKSNFIQMILYVTGRIEIHSERLVRLEKFTDKIIQSYLIKASRILKDINKTLIVSIPMILKQPTRLDISSIYEISDYHLPTLKKLFNSFYSEFILLDDEEDKLHLLYTKCDDFENIKYLTDFITLCKRKKIIDKNIVELLSIRYGITKSKSKEYLDEWININLSNPIRYREEVQNISIIIEKVLDRIKVSFYNLSNYGSFHECIDMINKIMHIYKLNRVERRSDLPIEINNLFKKNSKKIIVSVQSKPELLEPEPEEEPEPEGEGLHTDEVLSDDESDESDDESDDEYDDIDDELAGMQSLIEGESKYPNSRYYIKRLEMKDPRLIKYKPKQSRDSYSAKCQAAQDKQPISLTREELDEIDKKIGKKQEGISYSKPIQIKGSSEIYYICPKFWDRKHQIPIDPLSKYHPIEKDENGDPLEWRQFVWQKDYKNSDGEYFILERQGRAAGKSDSSSYWNKYADKDMIEKYQVQLIHDDIHPELLAIPCCGRKQYKITKTNIIVLVKDGSRGNKWINGFITVTELEKLNKDHECEVNIGTDKKPIIKTFHISEIKESKGHDVSTTIMDYTEFPLKENKYGKVNHILKDIFHMKPNAPFFKKKSAAKDIEMSHNGLYRVGVTQDSDSFLRSIDILSVYLSAESSTTYNFNMKGFKKNLLKDLNNLSSQEIFMIGNGSFVQYFRYEKKYDRVNYEREIIEDVKENLKNYLNSEEPKDDKLLIPLFMKCSEKSNNKLFGGIKVNILVLNETYEKRNEEIINTKIGLSEPLGGLNIYEDEPFLMIYKKDDYYEALMYYYNGSEMSSISKQKDDTPLRKTDIIYVASETGQIKSLKDDEVKIKYENGASSQMTIDQCVRFDSYVIYNILYNFIIDRKSKSIRNKKGIIELEDIHVIMTEKFGCSIVAGYYDNYHKLVAVLYNKNDGQGRLKIPIFIKPRKKDDIDFPLKKIKTLEKYSLGLILRIYSRVDKYIGELYPDKYLSYLSDKSRVIINDFNITIGYFMENGFIVPLKNKKYLEAVNKYNIIKGASSLSLQTDDINPDTMRDRSDTYFYNYNDKMKKIYDSFSDLYDKIIRNEKLKEELIKIVNHPIKLEIHKRWDLYDLLKDTYNEKRYKNLKLFIEYLLIHDLENLQNVLFQNYSSLKDYQMNTISDDFIIFNMKEFLTETYSYLFEKYSDYIRNISYYEHTDPNVNKILLKREFIEKPVSSYSKYPNTLKKIFTGSLMIYKNILEEEGNDINIIGSLLDSDITEIRIRKILLDVYENDDDSYILHNDLLGDIYKDNRELIASISERSYKLSLIDYEILSEELGLGFVIFSNRYSNDKQRYKTHIMVHKSLKDDLENNIQMLCLYEDLSGEVSGDSECKPISIKDKLIHVLGDLRVNREFNRLYSKSP